MNVSTPKEKNRRRTPWPASVIAASLLITTGVTGFVLHNNHQSNVRAEQKAAAVAALEGACTEQAEVIAELRAQQDAATDLTVLLVADIDVTALLAATADAVRLDGVDCNHPDDADAVYLASRTTEVEARIAELAAALAAVEAEHQAVLDAWQAHRDEQATANQAALLAAAQAALDAAREAGEAAYADSYSLVDNEEVRQRLREALDADPGTSPSRTQAYAWIIYARANDVTDAVHAREDRLAAEAASAAAARPSANRPGTGDSSGSRNGAGGNGTGGSGASGNAGGGQPAPPADGGHQQAPPAPPQEQAPPAPPAQEPCVCAEFNWHPDPDHPRNQSCYRWNRAGC
ncbi:MAG: hypothetical protein FWG11_04305 [Promicromonosporaceae bacterium]|nr:hypothetical protein [Promicromonosporaceae bacterium]